MWMVWQNEKLRMKEGYRKEEIRRGSKETEEKEDKDIKEIKKLSGTGKHSLRLGSKRNWLDNSWKSETDRQEETHRDDS